MTATRADTRPRVPTRAEYCGAFLDVMGELQTVIEGGTIDDQTLALYARAREVVRWRIDALEAP